jgi:hypothetical protein
MNMRTRNNDWQALKVVCSLAISIGMLAFLPGTTAAQGLSGFTDFCDADSYDNAATQATGLFTDLRRGKGINADYSSVREVLPGIESCPLNITGSVGAAGDMWITLLGGPGNEPPVFQCVFVQALVTIHRFDNRKAVGYVMNYDAETGMGLFWGLYDNGNTDALTLSTFDGNTGRLKDTVGSLPLKSKIKEGVPYALIAQVCTHDQATPPNLGIAFGFVTDFDTVFEELVLDHPPLPAGISPLGGQIGIAGQAKNAFVDATVEAFSWEDFGPPE